MQALRHQHDIDDVFAAGSTQIRLPLHHLACDKFISHVGIVYWRL
jgi:hypothetical protein